MTRSTEDRTHPGRALLAGLLAANSLPHLGTAAAGGSLMTPIAGSESGPRANAVWGAVNLVASLTLLGAGSPRPWRRGIVPFLAGAAVFASWAVTYEAVRERRSR